MASCGRLVIGLLLAIRITSTQEADPRERRIYLEQALD